MIHLKSKQEYVDRYDEITVSNCRSTEKFHRSTVIEGVSKELQPITQALAEVTLTIDLVYTTLYWWENKEQTIKEWMDDDAEKDRLLETSRGPRGVKCPKCLFVMNEPTDRIIYGADGTNRVLFLYHCPNKCVPHRALFNDGEEYKTKPNLCEKCHTPVKERSERIEDKKIVITNTCLECGHIQTDELDLSTKEKPYDPEYEKDRARFCLNEESAKKTLNEKWDLERMKNLVDKMKEEEKHKDDYEAIKRVQKLTVIDLEKLITPAIEKADFMRFQFGTPDINKDVFLPFTAYDSKPGRDEREGSHDLSKALKKALEETNWRLMSDGVSCRLGILSGRLRAYEGEEDLLELVRLKNKKLPKT